jgi:hypothetical protein
MITYWDGDCVSGDWEGAYFESLATAKKAGWVIDDVINDNLMGHDVRTEKIVGCIDIPPGFRNRIHYILEREFPHWVSRTILCLRAKIGKIYWAKHPDAARDIPF